MNFVLQPWQIYFLCLDKACKLNLECAEWAQFDIEFLKLREDPAFKRIVGIEDAVLA